LAPFAFTELGQPLPAVPLPQGGLQRFVDLGTEIGVCRIHGRQHRRDRHVHHLLLAARLLVRGGVVHAFDGSVQQLGGIDRLEVVVHRRPESGGEGRHRRAPGVDHSGGHVRRKGRLKALDLGAERIGDGGVPALRSRAAEG
jgi:hypothetical protein